MASMSVSGIVSGMDWEGMIDSIIESASSAAYVQVNKKTNLTNKKTLFEEMKVSMQSIQSSLSTLKLPSTYKAKEIDIERIDTNGSYKGVLTATVNADAEVNVHELEVKQLATAQTNRSKQITASTLKNTLGSLTSSKFYINAGGQQVGIDVYATDSLDSLKSRINTTLKSLSTPLAVSASVVDNKLILKSDYTGLGKTTVEGTLKDKYTTTGCTSLATLITNTDAGITTNIVVSDDYLDELKVTSGSSSYTIHKDYEVVNNEIRWKQYEDTNAVKLGDSVSAVYTMGKDDVIEVTATRGSSDSDSIDFGFDVKDYGTLGNRMKIKSVQTKTETEVTEGIAQEPDEDQLASETGVDEDGNEYVITYSYEEVQGDDEDDVTYTLTAMKTTYINTYYTYGTDFTYSDGKINWITKDDVTTNEPSSYTVSYTQDNSVNYSKTISRGTVTQTSTNEPDFYSVKLTTGNTTRTKSNGFYDDLTDIGYDELNAIYKNATGNDLPTTTVTVGTNTITCIAPDIDYRYLFNIQSEGKTYQYGNDFIIRAKGTSADTSTGNLQITWGENGATVVNNYKNQQGLSGTAKNKPSTGSDLIFVFEDTVTTYSGNVNAGDNDKRLSTIFGTEIDSSNYANLEIRGYTYGTDYEVQEDANGEAEIVWLNKPETLASDDDDFDITDLNTNYKQITGSDLSTVTLTGSDGVIRTYIDPDEDYMSALTITSGSDTYEYGRDFVIRVKDDGQGYVVSWLVANDVDGDGDFTAKDANVAVSTYTQYKDLSTLEFNKAPSGDYNVNFKYEKLDTTTKTVSSSATDKSLKTILGYELSSDEYEDLVIKNGTKTYEYGYDFTIETDDDGNAYISWIDQTPKKPSEDVTFTIKYDDGNGTTYESRDLEIEYDDDYSVFDLFDDEADIPSSFSRDTISITDNDGTEYYYGRDFKINTDGTIKWLEATPSGPDEKSEYTIIYESFDSVTSTADDEDNTILRISNSGYGNYSDGTGDYLSYEQILSSFGLSTSSAENIIDSLFKKSNLFTLTDDDDNTYTYGTDFVVRMSEDYVDGATGEHLTKIKWLDDGEKPSNSATLTLTYGSDGGEKFEMDEAITRSNSDVIVSGVSGTPVYSEFESGTVTINQAGRTYYQGYDFDVGTNDNGETVINWKTGTDYEWYLPNSGQYSRYTVNLVTSDGTEKTYSGVRNYEDVLDMQYFGFTNVSGNLTSVSYGGKTFDLTDTEIDEDGKTDVDYAAEWNGISVNEGTSGGVKAFKFDWVTPALTSREGLPTYGSDVEIEYDYCANTFSLSDEGDGIIDLLGLEDDVTQALNAVIELNGVEIEKDLNDIGADYENEISNLKGVTLHLKGTGKVSLDISHDAEKAVTSIQTFVENYNSLMTWINTRMTESQVDDDTAATIDSDDFRMRWGLLHGNSLLRNAKSSMRDITAKNYTFSFTERKSSSEVYGTMSYNGLRNDSTLRMRIGSVYADITISPSDTLQDIVDKISDSSSTAMRNIFYGSDGKLLDQPLIKASISGDKLVLTSTTDDEITLSGSSALNALKMNYTYKGVYQLGIATTSTDYGKSGEIEFDEEKFMEALEDNPDETQALMLKYVGEMDTWLKSMLNSSASGETSGTLTRQIQDLESQINNINDYLEDYQDRLDRMEENLRTKYAAAEQNISKLSQQASAMASILQTMTNSSSNNNSSSSSS